MATLETQYSKFKFENPESTFTFEQWKEWFGKQLEEALSKIKQYETNTRRNISNKH